MGGCAEFGAAAQLYRHSFAFIDAHVHTDKEVSTTDYSPHSPDERETIQKHSDQQFTVLVQAVSNV